MPPFEISNQTTEMVIELIDYDFAVAELQKENRVLSRRLNVFDNLQNRMTFIASGKRFNIL